MASVSETLLEDEWRAIIAADGEEASFCDVAAALGLDPYDIDDRTAKSIESLGAALGPELVAELAAAADPRRLREDVDWVTHGLKRMSHEPKPATGVLAKLRALRLQDDDSGPPWEIGWRQAGTVRKVLRITDTEPIGFDGMFDHRQSASGDSALQALASGVSGHIEVVLGIPTASRANGLSRGALFGAVSTRRTVRISSRPRRRSSSGSNAHSRPSSSPRPRAFAKMIDSGSGVALATEVERAARRFKVSPVVVGHQIENQLGLTIAG